MCKKNGDKPVRVPPHPPFPSFAWVMTAQSNPPSPAYAYGYVRNAHARNGKHARPPARRTAPPGCHHKPRYPRCTRPPPPLSTRAKAAGLAADSDEQFMDTVDYRYHDPPSRPYVPWLEGYASLRGRGAQRATGPDTTKDSNCTLAGSASSSDDARSKKRVRTRTTVDVVKINRLDIMLSALRRACRLSAKEEPGKP